MADVSVSLQSVVQHFESLTDPRDTRNRRHLLVDVIVISVCGVIVGCKGPTSIERWAKAKHEWLSAVLELPHGIAARNSLAGLYQTHPLGSETRGVSEMFWRMDRRLFVI